MHLLTDLVEALERGDATGATLAAIRLAVLGSAVYLAALLLLAAMARGRPAACGRLTSGLPGLRRMTILLGAGLLATLRPDAAGAVEPDPSPPPTTSPRDAPVLRVVPDDPPVMSVTGEAAPEPPPPSSTTSVVADAPAAVDDEGDEEPPAEPGAPTATPPPSLSESTGTWNIRPGDHLWHVAESTLAGAWSRTPSEAETARYWRTLIEMNHDRLVHPDDPDLVLPGQEIVLPPVLDG